MALLKDIDLSSIGNSCQMAGAVYSDGKEVLVCLFPEDQDAKVLPQRILEMSNEDWKIFLRQTDMMETEILSKAADGTLVKAMTRKCERNISQNVSWNVFRRDSYMCRYCANSEVPLTVDHLVRWEEGGPSIEANLLSACRKCNKIRGDKSYATWLKDPYYLQVSRKLPEHIVSANVAILATLENIPRKYHVASR